MSPTLAFGALWWLPTIIIKIAHFSCFVGRLKFRLWLSSRLLKAGRLQEADRIMVRIRSDIDRVRKWK